MNKYAIVKDGVVVNLIEYEEQPTTPPPGFEAGYVAIQTNAANPGWHYANGQFTDPNPPTNNEAPTSTTPAMTLTDMILADPTELAKLKQALGI
jgi:hypothetical protein